MGATTSTERRLRRLVGSAVLVAVALQVGVGAALHGAGPVAPIAGVDAWLSGPGLLGLLALCVAADLYAVRIRHGEEAEELTLAEAAAVVCALLLAPAQALLLPVLASVVCSLLRRREPLKLLFNAANVAIGSAVLLGGLHTVSSSGAGVSLRSVVGLVVGMSAFTAVNLVLLARVLAIVGDDDPEQVVRDGLRLSAVMALGTTGLGATAVVLADTAPALLPFSVLPAAALTFAYRAAAQQAEERQRSATLLELSQVLAGRLEDDDMIDDFLRLARQAFGADVATALLAFDDGSVMCASDDRVLDAEHGWTGALLAPLESDGRRLGALALGTRDRHRRLGPAQLTLLTPLAAALAVSLRGSDHLRRLLEETSKLQAVVDRSSDGILVLDGDGVVQLWSPAVEALTGHGGFGAVGAPLSDVVEATTLDGEPVDVFAAARAVLRPERPEVVVELVLHRSDGESRVVRCAHAGVFDERGWLERDVVLLHDITRERQVERLKADFIATVSHELRTPVTPIKGYADLLRRRGDAMSPERRAECLEVISDRAAHLARLVEDLLLASRISVTEGASPASVSMGRHDLVALVRRASGDFGDDGERLRLDLPDEPVVLGCDPVRTVQVVGNLVGNALKYSAPGTPVDVRLVVADGTARVEVTDQGRGIPADQLERVFEKFHRVEDPMRMTTGGTGLGLYIARQLTTAMGGELHCTSVLGVGSTFVLALPITPEPAADAAVPEPRTVPAAYGTPDAAARAARERRSRALG